jgi:hypothetical protein
MKALLTLLIASISFSCWAITIDVPPGQWQCMAVDKKEQNYGAFGKNMKKARHAALVECRRRSDIPKTCRTAQSYCEQGPISTIEDRCIVTDESGRTWNTTGKNACKTALSLCRQWEYLHGSTRSVCSVKHRMRNYDQDNPHKDDDDL